MESFLRSLCHFLWILFASEVGSPLPFQEHDLPCDRRKHEVVVQTNRHEYSITMGGTVDMDHALTREHGRWRVGWQPNEALTLENTGSVPVKDARLVMNGIGNWYDLDSLLAEATASAKSDQEKVYLIFDFLRSNRHHDDPLFEGPFGDELHDPVKMLAIYGAGLCDDSGSVGASMFHAAGFCEPTPFVRCLHGHMMCEVFCSNRWQFMDIDQNIFYLDRENELPVGGDAVARDHDLSNRELHYGPLCSTWTRSLHAAALFGKDDGKTTRLAKGYEIQVNLRPDERIEYRWDNVGKWAMRLPTRGRRWVGNSKKIYEPSFENPSFGAKAARGVEALSGENGCQIVAKGEDGWLLYEVKSAYVFCGGNVKAELELRGSDASAAIEAGPSADSLRQVWRSDDARSHRVHLSLDEAIDPVHGEPKYAFYVGIKLSGSRPGNVAVLTRICLQGDIMVSPIALPRLRLGENSAVYTDHSEEGRELKITHLWRETRAAVPPSSPKPIYPAAEERVRDPILTYRWDPSEGAVRYHIQVFRDPAMRWPYRPSLDVILEENEHRVPFWGIYSPDTTYYWRLRACNEMGIWGNWSVPQSFSWEGPRVPVEVKLKETREGFQLEWKPNPRGPLPVRYEVYGSDIKGFSVHREDYEMPTLGTVRGNYLGSTTRCRLLVAGIAKEEDIPREVESPVNLNRCYYRVVAYDCHGTPSGCSDYVETPHPYIWSIPPRSATASEPYLHPLRCLSSMGDLQHRYESPGDQFWEKEKIAFSLVKGPSWLRLDAKRGLLSGRPPQGTAGKYRVRVRVSATTAKRTGKDKGIPDDPERYHEREFVLRVCPDASRNPSN